MTEPFSDGDPYDGRYDGFLGEIRLFGRGIWRGLSPYAVCTPRLRRMIDAVVHRVGNHVVALFRQTLIFQPG